MSRLLLELMVILVLKPQVRNGMNIMIRARSVVLEDAEYYGLTWTGGIHGVSENFQFALLHSHGKIPEMDCD